MRHPLAAVLGWIAALAIVTVVLFLICGLALNALAVDRWHPAPEIYPPPWAVAPIDAEAAPLLLSSIP